MHVYIYIYTPYIYIYMPYSYVYTPYMCIYIPYIYTHHIYIYIHTIFLYIYIYICTIYIYTTYIYIYHIHTHIYIYIWSAHIYIYIYIDLFLGNYTLRSMEEMLINHEIWVFFSQTPSYAEHGIPQQGNTDFFRAVKYMVTNSAEWREWLVILTLLLYMHSIILYIMNMHSWIRIK